MAEKLLEGGAPTEQDPLPAVQYLVKQAVD